MELRVLRYFLTVAKEQSFTKAADQLHITQPTLSRQLKALEEELGTVLLNRGGHSITLTEDGLLLKRRALELIDLEDKIVDEFKGNDELLEGKITIGLRRVQYGGDYGEDMRNLQEEVSARADRNTHRDCR